jgi:hypothetical protein
MPPKMAGKDPVNPEKVTKVAKPNKTSEEKERERLAKENRAEDNAKRLALQKRKKWWLYQEIELARVRRLNITVASVTRAFDQIEISGRGAQCLWRSIARGYYGNENNAGWVLERMRALYAAATEDDLEFLGSPLQDGRRALYEAITANGGPDFERGLRRGAWGET